MLTIIREYGIERLDEAEEGAAARRAHADYYLDLADQAAHAFRHRSGHEGWLDRLELERSNFSVALMYLDSEGDSATLLRLAGALGWFWYIRGPLSEGRSWLERALNSPAPDTPATFRIRAMVAAGLLAHFQGDDDRARTWLEASLTQSSGLDDPWLCAFALLLLGMVAEDHGDYSLAELRFADALGLFRAADDESNAALALVHLGVAAWGMGDVERAEGLCRQAVALQRASGDTWGIAISLGYLGLIAGERGEHATAAIAHRESLELRWQAGVWEDVAACFADLAALAVRAGRAERAARLFGAADALREEAGRPALNLPERAVFEHAEERTRQVLGATAFSKGLADGRALPREQAVDEAVALAEEIAHASSNNQ
jgi:non-specific serine/threonine protein kinase